MTQQTESTRTKITLILEQVGMSDEELYQLLYGRQQQVEVDIALPQLMEPELWQITEHSVEELDTIQDAMEVLEQLVDAPLDTEAASEIESLLEGELVGDDVRGLLLKKRFKNWRKGMLQFLAFLAFSDLLKMALAMATATATHLIPRFENLKNRPQDRRVLSDFIMQQLEQPAPPILAALTAGGALFSPEIGEVEFMQPVTAAIIALDGDKVKQLREIVISEEQRDNGGFYNTSDDEEHSIDYQKIQMNKRAKQASNQMNKLEVLERTEALIAYKQALHQSPDQDAPQRIRSGNRTRGTGRRTREREAQEHEAATTKTARETEINNAPLSTTNTNKPTAKPSGKIADQAVQTSVRESSRERSVAGNATRSFVARNTTSGRNSGDNPKPILEEKIQPSLPPVVAITTPLPIPQLKPALDAKQNMAQIMEGMALQAFKGMKMEDVGYKNIGQTKSSLPKNDPLPPKSKPNPQIER